VKEWECGYGAAPHMFRSSFAFIATLALLPAAWAQQPAVSRVQPIAAARTDAAALPAAPSPKPLTGSAPNADGFKPTWETQKGARTYMLGIPAPRGQIVDRNGMPLAQTRVTYNLGLSFPTPLSFSETEALLFAEKQILLARSLTGRALSLTQDQVLKHYKNRGIVPLVIAQDLRPMELERIRTQKPEYLVLQPVYQRYYPNGNLACHIIGYAGRSGKMPDGVIENNELLWPNAEGRAGLEKTFDEQLQGKVGQYNISFDASGKKATEQISIPPQPGYNVVTTLDLNIQQLCEQSLAKGVKRGALVIVDPNNGDILAMASWPTFNPNLFVPNISNEAYALLRDDPENPLIPRAYQSPYPPGSTFKIVVGLAALQTGKVKLDDEFSCPPSMEIGNLTFRNWKKTDSGSMNFAEALTQSCDTWFYQVGMKIGSRPIIEYAQKMGLGVRTGIPLESEAGGRIPNDEYMMRVHKRKLLNGDIANLSIGQGDTETTPLQIAQAMVPVANGGTLYQMRLVQQVQSIDNQIVTGYDVRARGQVDMDKEVIKEIRKAMVDVVESGSGTAGRAQIDGIHIAGKTGTAQWGPKNAQRVAAWFCGFAPAEKPRYAFATIFESDVANNDVHGGTVAAPLVANVLKELFKDELKAKKAKKKKAPKRGDDEEEEMPVRRAEPVDAD
jgi:penicillin-binding protein 2